ncbi:hypothetical protein GCM10023084_37730 [Streptomyces lacrimifluminis]|uniref:Uncharacterized protein n=1 Tax=Streptomyces lacrimifluminis TaxID=1500077 RepID=A0A917L0A0_9ACTN|nr:hypothetical protein [Streptomyces lacrimifluminis]GGJ38744.1 hypothetical protein GCM10012282_39350 [Streptomyces lacrimifluminis]
MTTPAAVAKDKAPALMRLSPLPKTQQRRETVRVTQPHPETRELAFL